MTYRCLNHPSCDTVPIGDGVETHSLVCASQNTGKPITQPTHKWRGHSVPPILHGGQIPDGQDLEPVGYDGFGAPLYAHQTS